VLSQRQHYGLWQAVLLAEGVSNIDRVVSQPQNDARSLVAANVDGCK
jgi:hypothetical protein